MNEWAGHKVSLTLPYESKQPLNKGPRRRNRSNYAVPLVTETCIAVVEIYDIVLDNLVTSKGEKEKVISLSSLEFHCSSCQLCTRCSLSASSGWNSFHVVLHIAICFAICCNTTAGENNCAFLLRADTLSVFCEVNCIFFPRYCDNSYANAAPLGFNRSHFLTCSLNLLAHSGHLSTPCHVVTIHPKHLKRDAII